ncbi:hypothetical protein [Sphingomonas sp.]|uniref:hypothetical protein n=1 Tax=Sphingomonas sp. TaxID=28214 RepID=UPI0035AFFAD8
MRLISLLPLLGMAAACAPTAAQQEARAERAATERTQLAKALQGLTPDQPRNCMPQFPSRQVRAYGPTIVYTVSRSLKYVSQTQGGCESLSTNGRNDILVTRTPIGQLCAGDIAQTVDRVSGFFTGSCSFGEFTPYRRAK